MVWLRYVILVFILLSIYLGYRKGLVKTVISMVFLILVMLVSAWLNPYVTEALYNHTNLAEYVEEHALEGLKTDGVQENGSREAQRSWLESSGIPPALTDRILDGAEEYIDMEASTEAFVAYAASCIAEAAAKIAAFFVSFLLAFLFVKIVSCILELLSGVPGISLVNRVGGGAVGAVRALLWIWLLFTVLSFAAASAWGQLLLEQIHADAILEWLYDNNLILEILGIALEI